MSNRLSLLSSVALLLLLCTGSFAQGGAKDEPKLVSAPQFKANWTSDLWGDLIVGVVINETGQVTDVSSVRGPGPVCAAVERADVLAMREAAKKAALGARFEPAEGDGAARTAFLLFKGPAKPAVDMSKEQNYTAQTKGSSDPNGQMSTQAPGIPLSGGVLNGKAERLPKPPYPPAARAVRASGAVTVEVLIDLDGSVFSAEALSGHPLLRSASVAAACGAKFAPTQLSGKPVKVLGVITYNFVAP